MLKADHHKVVKELYAKGTSKREIARLMGVDIKTVRRHLNKPVWQAYQRPFSVRSSLLLEDQEWLLKEWLLKRMSEVEYNACILYREMKHKGYEGSYEAVKRFIQPHRPLKTKGCVRYETAPGHQAQVDWGSAWVWFEDKQVKVHFFGYVLGYSRRLYAKGFLDERFANLVAGHEAAFQWFGGLTQEILYDNAKTMITTHNVGTGELILNAAFKDFSHYYGFQARFCRPYRPQTKGKIESGVKYLKRNFLPGRRFKNLTHLNTELERWIVETADQRLHGTTHQRPADRFADETLFPLYQSQPYVYVPALQRKVSQDSMVSWAGNRYSVPWMYVGQCVDLRICDRQLLISMQGTVIALHPLLQGKHRQSTYAQHYKGLLRRSGSQPLKAPPQHDPAWPSALEVEQRDLALYDAICFISSSSSLTH